MGKFSHRECQQCGWLGHIKDTILLETYFAQDEGCPECKSNDLEWLTEPEYIDIVEEYND